VIRWLPDWKLHNLAHVETLLQNIISVSDVKSEMVMKMSFVSILERMRNIWVNNYLPKFEQTWRKFIEMDAKADETSKEQAQQLQNQLVPPEHKNVGPEKIANMKLLLTEHNLQRLQCAEGDILEFLLHTPMFVDDYEKVMIWYGYRETKQGKNPQVAKPMSQMHKQIDGRYFHWRAVATAPHDIYYTLLKIFKGELKAVPPQWYRKDPKAQVETAPPKGQQLYQNPHSISQFENLNSVPRTKQGYLMVRAVLKLVIEGQMHWSELTEAFHCFKLLCTYFDNAAKELNRPNAKTWYEVANCKEYNEVLGKDQICTDLYLQVKNHLGSNAAKQYSIKSTKVYKNYYTGIVNRFKEEKKRVSITVHVTLSMCTLTSHDHTHSIPSQCAH
jgi:hypothetical protein